MGRSKCCWFHVVDRYCVKYTGNCAEVAQLLILLFSRQVSELQVLASAKKGCFNA